MSDISNPSDRSQLANNLLDSIQRCSLYVVSTLLLVVVSSYNEYSLNLLNVKIPANLLFYISYLAVFLGYWNLCRLSSKLEHFYALKKDEEHQILSVELLFMHHWVLSPFGNISTQRIGFIDCVPIALLGYSSVVIPIFITRYFNNSDSLSIWSEMLPFPLMTGAVWGLCLVNVIFGLKFIDNVAGIVKITGEDRRRFWERVLAIILILILVEESIA